MAMSSGVYGPFLRDAITNAKAFALNASDTIKFDLVTDATTPDFNAHDELADITPLTGTGWSAGQTRESPTFAIAAGSWSIPIRSPPGAMASQMSRAWPAPPSVPSTTVFPGRQSRYSRTSRRMTGQAQR